MSAFITEMWSWYGLTWFITITRMLSRYLLLGSLKKFQIEDYLSLLAMCTDTVIMIGMSVLSRTGTNLFDPKSNIVLTPDEITNRVLGSKMIVVVECMQCTTVWLMKGCLLIMYYRITMSLRQNLAVKIVGVYAIFGYVLMIILYLGVWCRPLHGYWAVPQSNPECNASPSHLKLNAVLNISSDIMIILIPMPLLIKSKLPAKRKAVLCGVFALGTFTILSAILNKVYSFNDPYGENWTFWYVRESSTAIITANLPYVWTLLRRVFNLRSFNDSTPGNTSKSNSQRFQSNFSRNPRSRNFEDIEDQRVIRSDSQERINSSYSMPLKIYQRHEVEVTSEEILGDRPSRSGVKSGEFRTTASAMKTPKSTIGSGGDETGSERSVTGVVKAYQNV